MWLDGNEEEKQWRRFALKMEAVLFHNLERCLVEDEGCCHDEGSELESSRFQISCFEVSRSFNFSKTSMRKYLQMFLQCKAL